MDLIEEYKKAKRTLKQLEQHPTIKQWIEEEGTRLVQEHFNKTAADYKEEYPILTSDDINWIRDEPNHFDHEIHIILDPKTRIPIRVERNLKNSKSWSGVGGPVLTYVHFTPMSMTALWGGGYKELVDKQI